MWLPKPIYEALPAIYIIVGALFLAGSFYLGLTHVAAPPYAGMGVICLLSGVFVRARRQEARRNKTAANSAANEEDGE